MKDAQNNTINNEYRSVPISILVESATNPRRIFEDSALKELAESIRSQGVLSPLLVRPLTDQSFEIVAGARRYRAAQIAGPKSDVAHELVALGDQVVHAEAGGALDGRGERFTCRGVLTAPKVHVADLHLGTRLFLAIALRARVQRTFQRRDGLAVGAFGQERRSEPPP